MLTSYPCGISSSLFSRPRAVHLHAPYDNQPLIYIAGPHPDRVDFVVRSACHDYRGRPFCAQVSKRKYNIAYTQRTYCEWIIRPCCPNARSGLSLLESDITGIQASGISYGMPTILTILKHGSISPGRIFASTVLPCSSGKLYSTQAHAILQVQRPR